MRVVSLTCSNTEIVCALGCSDQLVGVDSHSDHPPEVVSRLPRVGKDLNIDVDAVAALEPDLVLASLTVPGHEAVVAGVEAAGLRFMAPEPVSLEDVYRDIVDIATALGVRDRGEALVAEMKAAMVPHDGPGTRILVEWWPKPVIVPGRKSWVHDLIGLAGGAPVLGDRDVKSAPITVDEAVALDPEAVVVSWCGVPDSHLRPRLVSEREGWAQVTAVREGAVHVIPEAYLGRPGPRLVDGYRRLREVICARGAT